MPGGNPQTSQCVKVPPGALGPGVSMATSWVPDGGVLHCRRGSRFAPSQVNSRGNVLRGRSGLETVSGQECPCLEPFTAAPPHPVSGSMGKTGPGRIARDSAPDYGRPGCEPIGRAGSASSCIHPDSSGGSLTPVPATGERVLHGLTAVPITGPPGALPR